MAVRPAVFLDRDGTIIVDKHYLDTPMGIRYIDGVREGLTLLKKHGFRIFIVSNQSGVGRGYFSLEMLRRINRQIELDIHSWGISIDAVEYCPHHPNERCSCRKPGTFMFERLFHRFPDIRPEFSFMIGDSRRDVIAAHRAGMRAILLTDSPPDFEVEFYTPEFHRAAEWAADEWAHLSGIRS